MEPQRRQDAIVSKKKVVFQIELELYERVVEAAEADRRSFSNWVALTVERALDEQDAGAPRTVNAAA